MTEPHLFNAEPDCLKNKTILVTGAGAGIGKAAALAYAKCGATVILAGKTVRKLEAVYDEIENNGWPQPAIYPIKLGGATYQDYVQMAESIEENFGSLDGILHNASMLGEHKTIAQTSVESWTEVMEVNVNAQFMLTKALMPVLEKAPKASVVFTSSGVGRKGRAYWGPYAVSKFATEGLVQVLADELENVSNIRVNAINPGATNTAMRRSAYPAEHPETNPAPEDIMNAYLYLMSDISASINGQSIDAQVK